VPKEGLTLLSAGRTARRNSALIIASLATGKIPYTTGQTISVDAGMLVPRF
jgi:3-oxoacyl-[acyl-carrier protein] reductase